jgi:hypothetical protein
MEASQDVPGMGHRPPVSGVRKAEEGFVPQSDWGRGRASHEVPGMQHRPPVDNDKPKHAIIRIKRKRNEAPMDTLLVEETERRASKKASTSSLVGALAGMSTNDTGGVSAPREKPRYIFKKLGTITAGQAADPEQSKRIASKIKRCVGVKRERNQEISQMGDDWEPKTASASQGEEDCMGKYFHVHDVNLKRARGSAASPESPSSKASGSAKPPQPPTTASTPTSSNLTLNGETLVRKPAKVRPPSPTLFTYFILTHPSSATRILETHRKASIPGTECDGSCYLECLHQGRLRICLRTGGPKRARAPTAAAARRTCHALAGELATE